MKKLVFGLFFICTSVLIFAQEGDTFKGFKLGIAAHPTFGYLKINGENAAVKSDGLRAGFSYGLLGDFAFADNYTFSTGILLTTLNGQSITVNNPIETKTIYKLQYIEIPLKLKLFTNQKNDMRFYGEVGLGNGINIGAKNDVKSSNNTEQKDVNISSSIAAYRGSVIIGGGAEFAISGKTKASAGLAFNNGFTNIQNTAGVTTKNTYIGLNLAVFF
ncbi:MAG: PorT family protein [Sphingobacteriales bacterium]|nr:MAG: PorT family protein [Sphingobacteriales bacterium]TAF82199.1 MAG: PorT family protein [Sphingobacteriales bacterium]